MSQPVNFAFHADEATISNITTRSDSGCSWKKELVNAITSVPVLLEKLELSHHLKSVDSQSDFKCLVTESYLSKIQKGDINDPLLLQVLPLAAEIHPATQLPGVTDPVGDIDSLATQGLLHKYHGRALLISTGACAIHCRYCFRRHYPYQQASFNNKALDNILDYLGGNRDVDEIILSGGDPLILDNEKLSRIICSLESIEHLQTLRIHTRLPVVLPSRIDNGLISLLQSSRFQIVMVIHANHANELGSAEYEKLKQLQQAGITLLNQSVLLKGINDGADTLIRLSKRLFACKTLPYYLHLLDAVKGAMHFKVDEDPALNIIKELEERLPGYLVPKLVQEIAGNKSKTAIFRI